MVRQNPVSNPRGTSHPNDPEFGRWLTRDLRPKGAPLSAPPPSAPPPAPPLTPTEAEVLAGWLTRDLTPKHSRPPPSGSVPPSAPVASPAPSRAPAFPMPFALAPRDSEFPAPPLALPVSPAVGVAEKAAAEGHTTCAAPVDSLAPQRVPSEPPSLPVVAPAALDEDDLAVLPGRRRSSGDRRKYAFVLLGVLCFAAAIVVGIRQRGASDVGDAASAASPSDVSAVLPPPPPSEADLLAAPEVLPEPQRTRRAGGADKGDDSIDSLDPRNALGGPSVRRYADVPSPTLSRLAREHRRLARERDEAARKAKAKAAPR